MVIRYRLLGQTYLPLDRAATADDHKVYYPCAERIAMRWTGDVHSGRLLDVQMAGRLGSGIAKRVDIAAAAAIRVD